MADTLIKPNQLLTDMFDATFSAAGIHKTTDTFKATIHPASANVTAASTWAGISASEFATAGVGYTAGGITCAMALDAANHRVSFADASWTSIGAGITGRYVVLRNTTNGNKIVAVIDKGADVTANNGGTFVADFPAADLYTLS